MIRPTNPRAKWPALPGKAAKSDRVVLRDASPSSPCLRLNPTAWAKLLYLRDLGDTEVGGFGISAVDDLLNVEDIQLVRQTCDMASVAFDDQSVADFFDRQVDVGLQPYQVGRIWTHTHPGSSPQPSQTDEETFARVFGLTDWAVMFILAHGGQTYARLQFHVGPGGGILIPMEVDYHRDFKASDHAAWAQEYAANVEIRQWTSSPGDKGLLGLADRDLRLLGDQAENLDDWWGPFNNEPGGFLPQTAERRHDDDF